MTVDQIHGLQDDDSDYIDPLANPDLANKLVAMAMGEDTAAPALIEDPPDGTVTLPGGFVGRNGVIRTATVRELTGADEEELAKPSIARDFVKQIDTLLNRCVLTIGTEKANRGMLDDLLIGDRDMLLQGIRVATYGDEMELESRCPHCGEEQTVEYSFSKDVPVKEFHGREVKLDKTTITLDANQHVYEIPLRKGRVADVHVITGGIQRAVYTPENAERSNAELNTILLAECINAINREPVTFEHVRNMTSADRFTILQFLNDTQPGPQWGEVKHSCGRCEREYPFVISVATMFRGL